MSEQIDLARRILSSQFFDPLTMFWLTLVLEHNFTWLYRNMITQEEYEQYSELTKKLFGGQFQMSFHRNVLAGHRVECGRLWDWVGNPTWKYETIVHRSRQRVYCVRTNEFIERAVTFAFMILRPLCGRDVAGLIARKVARMYLDDYEWMRASTQRNKKGKKPMSDHELEKQTRERLLRTLGQANDLMIESTIASGS
jgi:hypothetical protein